MFEIVRSYMNGRFSVIPGKYVTIENLGYYIKPSWLQANSHTVLKTGHFVDDSDCISDASS